MTNKLTTLVMAGVLALPGCSSSIPRPHSPRREATVSHLQEIVNNLKNRKYSCHQVLGKGTNRLGYIFGDNTDIRIYIVDSEITVMVKSTKLSLTYKIKDNKVMGLVIADRRIDKDNMDMYKRFTERLKEYLQYGLEKALEKEEKDPFYIEET